MRIKLQYSNGNTSWRIFEAYSINVEDCEFERRLQGFLNGGMIETPVGYRRAIRIDFEPLGDDKQALFFLYAWASAPLKQVYYYTNAAGHIISPTFDIYGNALSGTEQSITVIFSNDRMTFEHERNVFFNNRFTIEAIESTFKEIVDDGSTRILKPVYSPIGTGISGNVFTCYVNFVDQSSADFSKKVLRFLQGDTETRDFGYRHDITIDTGLIANASERSWLREFCLWKNKQLDTTGIDSYNGRIFDVVFAEEKLSWRAIGSVQEAKGIILKFKEKNLRTTIEQFTSPPSPYHNFILDTDQMDDTNANVG